MKKIIIIILNIFVWCFIYGQDPQPFFELSNPEPPNQTKDYLASEYIQLLPGFRAYPNQNQFDRAHIDPLMVFPPEGGEFGGPPNNNEGGVVGTIQGLASVTPSGAGSYTIPLEIPSGINGMTPNIGLVYNSQAGNGTLGIGWNLSGLSIISRTGSTIYHNNMVDGVDFDANDNLSLDGQRLLPINNGAEYRTEIESFSKIEYEAGHFTVWKKDGLIYQYGFTEESRIQAQGRTDILLWLVNRIEDRKGNFIEFNYWEGLGQAIIQTIRYSGNDLQNISPFYTIEFNYSEGKVDPMHYYIAGSKMENYFRLEDISIYYNNASVPFMKYQLGYNNSGSQTHLERVKLIKSDGQDEEYYNPTLINWGDENHQVTTETLPYDYIGVDKFFLDFNGDGKSDMVEAFYTMEDNLKVYTSWQYRIRNNGSFSNAYSFQHDDIPELFYSLLVGDYNGDGYQDIARLSYHYENRLYVIVDLLLLGKASGGFDEYEVSNFMNIRLSYLPVFSVGDFDGNGTMELLIIYKDGTNYGKNLWMWQFSSTGPHYLLLLESEIYICDQDVENANVITADFTGEGATDILVTTKNHNSGDDESFIYEIKFLPSPHLVWLDSYNDFPTNRHRIFIGDFNGDHISDVLTYSYGTQNPQWEIYCYNGLNSWAAFTDIPNLYNVDPNDESNSYCYAFSVEDFNGDGLSDIAQFKKDGDCPAQYEQIANYTIFYNNGNEFMSQSNGSTTCYGALDFYGIYCGTFYNHTIYNHISLDFNGDGRPDIYKGQGNYHDEILFFDKNYDYNFIKSIISGLGHETDFNFEPLSNNSIYTKGPDSQYPKVKKIQFPLYVVSSIISNDGIGGTFTKSYLYEGGMFHNEGKGFLGFTKTQVTDANTQLKTVMEYDINNTYYYNYLKHYYYYDGTKLLSQVIYQNAVYEFEPGSKRIFTYTPVSLTLERSAGDEGTEFIRSIRVENTYDENDILYGNLSEQHVYNDPTAKTIDEGGETYDNAAISINAFNVDEDNWLISRPLLIISNKLIANEQYDQSWTWYYYYSPQEEDFPLLKDIVIIPNGENSLKTNYHYDYDEFGNTLSKTLSAPHYTPALASRTESYEYSPDYKHRFLTRKYSVYNSITYSNQFTYDPPTGNLLTSTDENGHITSHGYGTMGNLEITTLPDGNQIRTLLRWADGALLKPVNGLYYSWTKSSGNAETIEYFDCLGRKLRGVGKNFDGTNILVDNVYNNKGQLFKTSEPYSEIGHENWTEYTYLNNGKVKTIESPLESILYTYNGRTVLTQNLNTLKEQEEEYDAMGNLKQYTDECGSVNYLYYSSGNVRQIETNGATTSFTYDKANRQETLNDPDAGTSIYHYNAYGELESQTDANGNRVSMHYDQLGRMTDRYIEPTVEYIRYLFDTKPYGIGLLSSVTGPASYQQEFFYDGLSRLIRKDETIDGGIYSYATTYDIFGRVKKEIYPSGFSTINRYNPIGYLSSIARGDTEKDIWRLEEMNPRGQINRFALGNGLTTTHGYDEYGFLTGITTDPGIQSLTYNFDHASGNLSYRTDNKYILTEEFDYDENLLNSRLTQCKINGTVSLSTNYQNNGNIDTKSDVGTYSYSGLKPHALKTVDVPEPGFLDNSPLQQITYTAVGKVRTITQDNPGSPGNPYLLNLYYGPDNQRIKSELFYGLTRINSKIFGQSGYESIVDQAGNKIQLHYLTSPSGVFAVYVKANNVESLYYIHTDHLGSLYAITGEDGRIVTQNGEEAVYSFDAWGRRRNPVDWSYEGLPSDFLIDRGFTFHEHLDAFGLINMNGRVYDPVIGRFLSPDNYVQGGFTQSFNRYSYCGNNPLIYTDPTGEIFWTPIIIGAIVGAYMGGTIANDGNYNPIEWDYKSGQTWGYMLGGAVVGGLSGYVGGVIAASEIPMANTLGIAGASITNSIGTYTYTGGKTDISISIGVASYNFTHGEWGYIGKKGNSVVQNIGYGLGAIANFADLYKFGTWDILNPEQKVLKLQKATSDNSITYDPSLQKSAQYDPNTNGIVFGKDGLNGGMGWAKSSYQHEALHRTDFTIQPTIPSNIFSHDEYYAFLDSRAYRLELSNSFMNGLSYRQNIWLQQKLINYSNIAGIDPGTFSNYTFMQWIRSLLMR